MNARYLLASLLLAVAIPAAAQPSTSAALPEISAPLEFHPQAFDVLHYDATLDLTKAPLKTMRGTCEITFRWTSPPDGAFYFHLRDLTIDSVFYNGVLTTATAVGKPADSTYHYTIIPPATARDGDTDVVRIVYGGEMTSELGSGHWGGVSTGTNGPLYALGVGFYNNYVSATEHWLPCYDHPSDKATFRGRFRVMKDKAVASNGTVTILPESDSTVIYQWTHDIPCATYLLTFAVDTYVPLTISDGPPPMVVYARPADTAATRRSFKLLPRMVSGFASRFGPYPFEKVGYVNTTLGAMEHQTMISFPTSLSQSGDTLNTTGAHELSHQWFGDLVSPLDFRNAWLNESFATFCESVWLEELRGFPSYINAQEAKRSRYIKTVSKAEGIFPLYDFPRAQPSSNYPETIYQKGAVVVGMLRYEMGDSLFFAAIRDYLRRYAYSTATTTSLRAMMEEHAGRSLGWFFDQWVYGKGWPVVTVKTIPRGANRVDVELNQVQTNTSTIFKNLPVELGFKSANGETVYRVVRIDEASQTITLDSIPDFTSVTINQGPSLRALMEGSVIAASGIEWRNQGADPEGTQFIVRPNLVSGWKELAVEVEGADDCAGIAYEIYDMSGQRVLTGKSDRCQFTIPITHLGSGQHMIRFGLRHIPYNVPIMIAR